MLAVFPVTNLNDGRVTDFGDQPGTLRQAIFDADETPGADLIVFNSSLSGRKITLTQGELAITESVTIDASMLSNGITVDASGNDNNINVDNGGGSRIFNITGGDVKIKRLTLTGGDVGTNGGAIYSVGASLTIDDCLLSGNSAQDEGGALFAKINDDTFAHVLTITDSTLSGNHAVYNGGAIAIVEQYDHSIVSIERSIIQDNTANSNGGGIYLLNGDGSTTSNSFWESSAGDFSLTESIISGNHAGHNDNSKNHGSGGGIYIRFRQYMQQPFTEEIASGSVVIERNQVSDNHAYLSGGGIKINTGYYTNPHFEADVTLRIQDTTISNNTAFGGGDDDPYILGHTEPVGGGGIALDVSFLNEGSNWRAEIINTTVSDNKSRNGGGMQLLGPVSVKHSTITLNEAGHLDGFNVPANTLTAGGGVLIGALSGNDYFQRAGGMPSFHNTIIAGNLHPGTPDMGFSYFYHGDSLPEEIEIYEDGSEEVFLGDVSLNGPRPDVLTPKQWQDIRDSYLIRNFVFDYSLIGNPWKPLAPSGSNEGHFVTFHEHTFLRGVDPLLGPLQDNGGFELPDGSHILTHALLKGSPAINAGDPAIQPAEDSFDQRGPNYLRVAGGQIDIGAFEVGLVKVVDVVLDNPSWTRAPYSFADVVPLGEQLRPFATQNVTTLQIRFSEQVQKKNVNGDISALTPSDGNLMELKRTIRNANGSVTNSTVTPLSFNYDSATSTATWTFATPLADGKYAIHLKAASPDVAGIVDMIGNPLDGDWENLPGSDLQGNPTWDDYHDDPQGRILQSGGATAGSENNEFRFHFALLAGDYDGDGVVEHAGEAATGDGNGDNHTNATDTTIGVLNSRLPMNEIYSADFNGDERVDGADLIIWRTGYKLTAACDADGDGDSDGEDLLIWQRMFGNSTAWADEPVGGSYAEAYRALLGVSFEDITIGLPPQVLNVIVSGSLSAHNPFSFDTVDGSGAQLGTVPVGLADTISIVFSENVNVSADTLFIVGLRTANLPELAEFAYDPLTFTATWRFEGWVFGDNYLLHLDDSITDTDGNFLDGEWVNPASRTTNNALVSEFPSGDGNSGGSFAFMMTLLAGDMNLDAKVDMTDYNLFVGSLTQGGGTLFVHGDFNGSGTVSAMDIAYFTANYPLNLQTPYFIADLDQDGDVDDDDLAIMSDNFGSTSASWDEGDLNDDRVIDDLDLDLAFAQYGRWFESVA
jgi:hypothetical protein